MDVFNKYEYSKKSVVKKLPKLKKQKWLTSMKMRYFATDQTSIGHELTLLYEADGEDTTVWRLDFGGGEFGKNVA